MSTSAIKMVLDELKELFRAKELTCAEYKEAMIAHHRAESSVFLLREHGSSQGVLTYEQHQALRMAMDNLKELFRAKELTYEQYRVQLAASLLQPTIDRLLMSFRCHWIFGVLLANVL